MRLQPSPAARRPCPALRSRPDPGVHLLSPKRSWPGRPGAWLSCHVAGRRVSVSKQKTVSETCRSLAAGPLPEDAAQREGLRAGTEGVVCRP